MNNNNNNSSGSDDEYDLNGVPEEGKIRIHADGTLSNESSAADDSSDESAPEESPPSDDELIDHPRCKKRKT